jgi:hypothetical protein
MEMASMNGSVVSNDSFITITGASAGTGSGTIAYTVLANLSTNDLTGSIAIGGQAFTVTQAGAK